MNFFDIGNPNLYISIILTIVNSAFMVCCGYKFFQVLQLEGYSIRSYGLWLKDTKAKWVSRIIMLFFLTCVALVVSNVLLGKYDKYELFSYIGLIFYFAFLILFIVNVYKVPQKTPLKLTKRMWRLIVVYFILMLGITFLLLYISYTSNYAYYFRYASITLTILLIPGFVPLANYIVKPLEKFIKHIYKNKSRRRLNKIENLKIIGITGSYGKTSTKNYLNDILSRKYKVYASPASYNTPMGLSKVILKELKDDTQIFIAEMGAIRNGEIKEICDFVKPDIALLTGIGDQHLKTFKTKENIKKTKYELINSLNSDGYAYFNLNSDDMVDLSNRCTLQHKQTIILNDESQKYTANNITCSDSGLKFDLKLDNEVVKCQTKILGEHNVQNIVMAAATAYELGVSSKDIRIAISKLQPVNHRLELSKAQNGVTIIDDSFNANVDGTKMALKTLSYFKDKRKVILTPGLVELGDLEAEANEQFGKEIAKVCDVAIIVNKTNAKAIRSGLESQNFPNENMFFVETLNDATKLMGEILKRGDVVLLENDLPDNYI